MSSNLKIIMKTGMLFALCILLGTRYTFGHGGEDHTKKKDTVVTEVSVQNVEQQEVQATHDHSQHNNHNELTKNKPLKADLDDFPTLHPLVVHFPIVLLLLAALCQLAGFFVFKNQLSWVTMFLIAGGFFGAYVAGNYVHPHTHGLSEYAEKVLKEHENYASYTTWLGGIALLLKIASHFLLKRKLWGELMVTLVLVVAAYCVSTAGHFGAQLIHIEGVGAEGKYLDTEQHNHQH